MSEEASSQQLLRIPDGDLKEVTSLEYLKTLAKYNRPVRVFFSGKDALSVGDDMIAGLTESGILLKGEYYPTQILLDVEGDFANILKAKGIAKILAPKERDPYATLSVLPSDENIRELIRGRIVPSLNIPDKTIN